jgi:uncharacterized phage protein (TIGR01671 family)
MREIIFRGKGRDNGKWYEGDLGTVAHKRFIDDGKHNARVIPETVGQFTGLTDINGKRIFEGDILKVQTRVYVEEDNPVFGKMKALSEGKRTRYWVVEWGNQTCGGASWYFYGKDRRFNRRASKSTLWNSEAEVVGNIHDNPELMEEDA